MSKLAVFTSLFALIVMSGICPSRSVAQSQWQQSTLNTNRVSIEVGAKVFDRPGDESNIPVVFDSITGSTLLSSERATDFGSNFGLEAKVIIPGHYDRNVEFRTVLVNWDEENSIAGDSLASSFFPDALNPPQTFDFDIEADYYSFELMRKRSVRPGLIISGGARYISTSDLISTTSTATTIDPVLGTVTGTQLNSFDAKNSLVGLQLGLEYNQPVAQAVYLSFFGRAGGYYNGTTFNTTASASDTLGVTDTTVTRTRRSRSTESFVGEAGGRVNFQVLPNCFSTYIGYEATVIDGIALAAANVDPINTIRIDTKNTLFFQAITFGANFTY